MAKCTRKQIGRNVSIAAVILLILLQVFFVFPAAAGASAPDLALMAASDLKQNRQAWAILDARPKAEWQAGHIEGSHSFSWDDYTRTDEKGTPYRLLPPQELAAALTRMGIDENTPVAVYGDADKSWGGEGWTCWVLSRLGHKGPIRLLTGGIQAWRDLGGTVTTEQEKSASSAAGYQVSLRPELDVQTVELEKKEDSIVLIDCRSTTEWLMGHIPGAIHIPWDNFYTGRDRRPLGPDALQKLLESKGVDTSRVIVYYCAGGVRSGYTWMVHTTCGLPPARNYGGGMEEWKRRSR